MGNLTRLIIAALVSCPVLVSAQTPAPVDSFQIRFQSNLPIGDGVVILTPTPAASPAAKASVAPAVSAPTQALTTTAPTLGAIVAPPDTGTNTLDKNIPIEGSQVNNPPTSTSTGTFNKNVPIHGSQVNKAATGTGTGTTTFNKNVRIKESQAASNTTGAASHSATTARINSKRDVTNNVQSGGERNKKKKQKQQLQEADSDAESVDRGDESHKKQKQQHQLQFNQPPG